MRKSFPCDALLLCLGALLVAQSGQAQTLERIQRSGVFTIAHREASVPLSYIEEGRSTPHGLAVALCQRIAKAVQAELKLPRLELRYLPVSSANRIQVIQEGKADIECGSTTDNQKRREQVGFSHHHFFAAVQFLTRSNGPKEWGDLEGKTVVFTKGTSTQAALLNDVSTKDLKYKVLEGKDHTESFALLAEGKADVFVLEDVLLAGLRASAPDPQQFVLAGRRLTIEPYALMLRKDDEAFQRVVNRELTRLFQSGEYSALYRQWFQSPIPPKKINLDLPVSGLLRAQIRRPSSLIPG